MLEQMLDAVLTEYYDHTLANVDMLEHKFSRRHERAMKLIFKRYEINAAHLHSEWKTEHTKITYKNARKRIIVVLVLVFLGLITGFTSAYFISHNFRGDIYNDNTNLFAVNTESPTAIEEKYCLTGVPNGFEIVEIDATSFYVYTCYENSSSQSLSFRQWVKQEFDAHLNTEYNEIEIVDVDGHEGLIVDHSDNEHNCVELVWSNNDYVFELVGSLSREDALLLAKSIEIS